MINSIRYMYVIYSQYQFKVIVVLASIEVVLTSRSLSQSLLLCYHVFCAILVGVGVCCAFGCLQYCYFMDS